MADTAIPLSFHSESSDPELASLALLRVDGRSRLSEPYVHELRLVSEADQGLSRESIHALLSNRCSVAIGDATIGGILREITTLPTIDPRHVEYRAVLVPALYKLSHAIRSRVFQTQTPMEIVAAVLTEHGVTHQLELAATYPVHEYVVQYAESDLAFVTRLLEHWGVFYYFEQAPDGETMVLADDNKAFVVHDTFAQLTFDQDPDHATRSAFVGPVTETVTPGTGSITLRDYNWRSPYVGEDGTMRERQLQLRATTAVDEATGYGEIWRYGDHFKDEASGRLLATVRAQQELVDRVKLSARCRAPGLAPGHRVSFVGVPLAELDAEYVVVETRASIDSRPDQATHTEEIHVIPADVAFRPSIGTAKPRIYGFMHAVVDGEVTDTTSAPIDALGRYKVIMPYDVAAAAGGRASRWIRMAQPSAGSEYGMHLPLHVGTEVAVYHLDGDPDRPVIAGSIPNIDTTSPVVDANATQSRIKTRGSILFELEDDA